MHFLIGITPKFRSHQPEQRVAFVAPAIFQNTAHPGLLNTGAGVGPFFLQILEAIPKKQKKHPVCFLQRVTILVSPQYFLGGTAPILFSDFYLFCFE